MNINKLPDRKMLDVLSSRMATQFQLPAVYDDALSYQGLIYKLMKYIQDTIQNVSDWNDWLEDFVETFDSKLQDTVKETIQEWVDDGTIQVIISEALQWELDDYKVTVNEQLLNKINRGELFIDVKDFGAIGDGVVDDSQAFIDALDATPIGGTLVISNPSLFYNLKTWETYSLTKPITIIGINPTKAVVQGNSTSSFLDIKANIYLFGVTLKGFDIALTSNVDFVLDKILIKDCVFADNPHGAVLWRFTVDGGFDYFVMDSCEVYHGECGVFMYPDVMRHVHLTNNYVHDLFDVDLSSQIRAFLLGLDTVPGKVRGSYVITGNTIENLNSILETECQGIMIHDGKEAIIDGNTIKNISNSGSKNCEAIYLRRGKNIVSNNHLIDAGGQQGTITIKEWAKASIITSNSIIVTSDLRIVGIYNFATETLISNNYIENTVKGIVNRSADTTTFSNVSIISNIIKNTRGYFAIDSSPARRLTNIRGNVIDIVLGIATLDDDVLLDFKAGIYFCNASAGKNVRNHLIEDNIISNINTDETTNGAGILIRTIGASEEIIGMTISGNTLESVSYGLYFVGKIRKLLCSGNIFNSENPIKFGTGTYYVTLDEPTETIRRGIAGIAPGLREINITHNISPNIPLEISDIQVIPISHPGTTMNYWVDRITDTSFVIRNDIVSDEVLNFSWRIDLYSERVVVVP